jgi:hypothetical protein
MNHVGLFPLTKRHVAHSLKSPDLSMNFFWVVYISWSDILYSISFCFCGDRHTVRRGYWRQGSLRQGQIFLSPYFLARWTRPKLGTFDRSSLKREARRFLEKLGENSTLMLSLLRLQIPEFMQSRHASNLGFFKIQNSTLRGLDEKRYTRKHAKKITLSGRPEGPHPEKVKN